MFYLLEKDVTFQLTFASFQCLLVFYSAKVANSTVDNGSQNKRRKKKDEYKMKLNA